MWDEPSAEVTHLKKTCETMLENYEDEIEDWYYNHQEKNIQDFLCRDRILKESELECLDETWTGAQEERVHVEEQTLIENLPKDEF